jgi:serpin B
MKRLSLLALMASVVTVGIMSPGQARDGKQAPVKADLQTLVQGNQAFAFDLYGRLREQEGNIVFSPYSISTALAMTYGGARGETAEKMARVLHFVLPADRLHPAFGLLTADLQKEDKGRPYHLHVANALWPQAGSTLVPEFRQLTRRHYAAGLEQLDFSASEAARQTINRWVEEKTRDKIKDLLLPGDLTPATRLVLTNAIYFKATWKNQFPRAKTKDAVFEVTPGDKVSVPMMQHPEGLFAYHEGDGCQWLDLPYQGDRLSMVLLLPQRKGQLADLEKGLTAATLQKGLAKLQMRPGQVYLPRFRITFRTSLLQDLRAMGMPGGPFSAIVSGEDLLIKNVIHKAFIDVDEVGTEAAAATAVLFGDRGGKPFTFRADHPFLFLIRDTWTGSILFLGRVTNPRVAEGG